MVHALPAPVCDSLHWPVSFAQSSTPVVSVADRRKELMQLPLFKKAAEALGAQLVMDDPGFNPLGASTTRHQAQLGTVAAIAPRLQRSACRS